MRTRSIFFFGLALFTLAFRPALAQNASHVKVELISETSTIQPGGAVTVGLYFKMQKGWHVYWENPGDSGQSPTLQWSLPEGFTVGEVIWPTPKKISLPSLADYGYTNEVLLMVPLQAPTSLKPGHMVRLSATAHWLVCQEICIPGSAQMNLRFGVSKKAPKKSRNAFLFQKARKQVPQPMPDEWKADGSIGAKEIRLSFDTGKKYTKALFFPLGPNQVENAKPQKFEAAGSSFRLILKRSDQLLENIKTLEGVLTVGDKKSEESYLVSVPLTAD